MEEHLRAIFSQAISTVLVLVYLLLLGLFVCYRVFARICFAVFAFITRVSAKHGLNVVILRRRWIFHPVTLRKLLATTLYWGLNIAFTLIGVDSLKSARARTGQLSVANCIPLLLVEKLWLGADALGISIGKYQTIHSALGVMTTIQVSLHLVVIAQIQTVSFAQPEQLRGFLGGFGILLAAISTILKRRYFEIFSVCHRIGTIAVLVGLWTHAASQSTELRPFILACLVAYASSFLFRIARIMYRNMAWGSQSTHASLRRSNDTAYLDIKLSRPLRVEGGQTVYLWIPGASFWSFLQTHPFVICWQQTDEDEYLDHVSNDRNFSKEISLIIRAQEGLSRKLMRLEGQAQLKVMVDGPYGRDLALEDYGTIVFVLEGIGIAAAISHIRNVLEKRRQGAAYIQRLKVIWQMEEKDDVDWVQKQCNKLLVLDQHRILRFHLYTSSAGREDNERVKKYGSRILGVLNEKVLIHADHSKQQAGDAIQQEIERKVGKTLFLVSAGPILRDAVQRRVLMVSSERVSLSTLDFQPYQSRSIWARTKHYEGTFVIESPVRDHIEI